MAVRRAPLLRRFGRRVAALRHERGLTQEALAAQLGVSERYVRRIEGGDVNPSLVSIARLAEALRAPMADLVAP